MFRVCRITALVRCGLIVCGILALAGRAPAESKESAPRYRQVVVRVMDERGELMPGVSVQMLGTGRDALQATDIDSKYDLPGLWRFVTDAHGRCTVRLGCFTGFDSAKVAGREEPGWGRFYFIAQAGHLRGVSLPIIHEREGRRATDSYDDEWNRHGAVRTSGRPVAVTLRMRRGVQVSGRVIDTAGKPMQGFDVNVQHDLRSEHHTGYGNEIFRQSATTDGDGRFALPDIFPNTFYLNAAGVENNPPVWVRTKLRGKWAAEAVDKITPRRGERTIHMTIVVSPELPYHYTGRVRDESGKPIAGAALVLGLSQHRVPRTHADSHEFLHATTDQEGRFEFRTATPFVLFLDIGAPGFTGRTEDYEERKTKAPRQWNITLHPAAQ